MVEQQEEREIISVKQASILFGLDPSGYHRAITAGELRAWKIRGRGKNGQWRMRKEDVRDWMLGQPSQRRKAA